MVLSVGCTVYDVERMVYSAYIVHTVKCRLLNTERWVVSSGKCWMLKAWNEAWLKHRTSFYGRQVTVIEWPKILHLKKFATDFFGSNLPQFSCGSSSLSALVWCLNQRCHCVLRNGVEKIGLGWFNNMTQYTANHTREHFQTKKGWWDKDLRVRALCVAGD